MTASEVLNAAADLIEKQGWTQRGFIVDGRVCALGAIALSAHTYDEKQEAKALLRERLAERYGYVQIGAEDEDGFYHRKPDGSGYHVISEWNNHWRRTQEQVVAMLRGK